MTYRWRRASRHTAAARTQQHVSQHRTRKLPDTTLLIALGGLLFLGLVILSSASSVEAFRKFGDTYFYFRNQITHGLLPGLLLGYFAYRLSPQRWEQWAGWCLLGAFVLLVLVFIPGIGLSFGRAQSWIKLGPASFQPAELVKFLVIIFLAAWFGQRTSSMNRDFWNGLVPFLIFLFCISFLVILQPDLGTLSVILAIAGCMYVVGGGAWRHIAALGMLGAGAIAALIWFAPYRFNRLMTFLNPELDPQGIGYHINQAFLAVGSGGWFGLGFGQSRQKFAYLPEVIGDSIFAVAAEELGFFLAASIVVLFAVIVWRCFMVARRTPVRFNALVAVGVGSWFGMQAFMNIGAMVGIMPLTGIPLPLVSYGGSSMMSILLASGVLLRISQDTG